jgi:hypothetical protein
MSHRRNAEALPGQAMCHVAWMAALAQSNGVGGTDDRL